MENNLQTKFSKIYYSTAVKDLVFLRNKICDELQMSKSSFYLILNGKKKPKEIEKKKIAEIFNKNINEIFDEN